MSVFHFLTFIFFISFSYYRVFIFSLLLIGVLSHIRHISSKNISFLSIAFTSSFSFYYLFKQIRSIFRFLSVYFPIYYTCYLSNILSYMCLIDSVLILKISIFIVFCPTFKIHCLDKTFT